LQGNAVVDYVDDASSLEAYLEWHPVPDSESRHRLKLGAFYPPLSLANIGAGWSLHDKRSCRSPPTTTAPIRLIGQWTQGETYWLIGVEPVERFPGGGPI
jgi:hypothetical protein